MPCSSPLKAFRTDYDKIVFSYSKKCVEHLLLPCGQCDFCRLKRSRAWAVRCMHEASLHDDNCFITLTYNDDHLPSDNSLCYRDFQLFMKRLRFRFPDKKIRFYMAGEYGDDFGRPHYHACLFGINFEDRVLLCKSPSGAMLYRSSILEDLWTFGYSSVGNVTFESAAYVARYIMKKVTGSSQYEHYEHIDTCTGEYIFRTPEFNRMSLKPGIASGWYDLYKTDVYPIDHVIVKGKANKPPRYYDNKFKIDDPDSWESVLTARIDVARIRESDHTPERLAVEAECLKARLTKLKRVLK